MRIALLALIAAAGCSSRASERECDRATDRMIEIFSAPRVPESGKVPPEAQQEADLWSKNLKERDPTKATLMQTCKSKMTGDHVKCVLAALDEKSLAACFE
jgi:hypothetical protein